MMIVTYDLPDYLFNELLLSFRKKSKDTKYLQVPVVLNVVVTTQENGWSEPMGTTTPYKPIWRNVTSSLSPERAKPCVVGIGIF